MSEVEEIIETAYEIFKGSEEVPILVDKPNLGMAYAIDHRLRGVSS